MAVDLLTEQQRGLRLENDSTWRLQSHPSPRNLKKESDRLKTFVNWNVRFLSAKELAKDGFFYTNTDDIVKCAFCRVQIGFWEEGDVVRANHVLFSPDCPLINGRDCGNVPISEENEEVVENEEVETEGVDVYGPYGLEIRPFSGPERPGRNSLSVVTNDLRKYLEELGVSKLSGPVYPQFSTYESRLKTFETWKYHEIQTPERLADAGLIYNLTGDQVLCFYCGGGLHKWKADDDPWVDHARFSSKCGYVILRKGEDFVREVCSKGKVYLTPSGIQQNTSNYGDSHSHEIVERFEDEEDVTQPQRTESHTPSPESEEEESSKDIPELDDNVRLCRICYVREREIVSLPCGHFISCTFCASSLSSCALCRDNFEAVVRVNLVAEEKEPEKCLNCRSAQKQVVFLPCRHFINCCECASRQTSCSLCKEGIKMTFRAYLS